MLTNILIASAASAAVALVMGAYFRWLHRRYVTPLDYPNKEISYEIEQIRVVRLDCTPDKALLEAHSALLTVPTLKGIVITGRKLKAKTRVTFRTFGETITIVADTSDQRGCQLTIDSKPRFSGTTVDHGKSYENVERIVAYLSAKHSVTLLSANNSFKPTPLRGAA